MNNVAPEALDKPPDQRRKYLILAGGCGGLLVLALGFLVVMLLFDPFGIVDRLFGAHEPLANVMPQDTQIYLSIDLQELDSDETSDLLRAFGAPIGEDDSGMEAIIADIDDALRFSYGFTFTDDVKPWIGQSIALGFTDIETSFYAQAMTYNWILAAEVRNGEKADAFFLGIADLAETNQGYEVREHTYQEARLYVAEAPGREEGGAFGRAENIAFFSSSLSLLEQAIDTTGSDSLASVPSFRTVVAELPRTRAITLYLGGGVFEDMVPSLAGFSGLAADSGGIDVFESLAASVAATHDGLQVDVVAVYTPDQLPEISVRPVGSRMGPSRTAELFPEGTTIFVRGAGLDQVLPRALGQGDVADFQEAIGLLGLRLGIDLQDDLLAYLDGEFGIGLVDTSGAGGTLGIPVGFLAVAETSDEAGLAAGIESLVEALRGAGSYQFSESQVDGVTLYSVASSWGGPGIAFGAGDDHLFVASETRAIQNALEGRPSLEDSAFYRQMDGALPSGMDLVLCFDIPGMIEMLQIPFLAQELGPMGKLQGIVVGSEPLKGDVEHVAIVIVIGKE